MRRIAFAILLAIGSAPQAFAAAPGFMQFERSDADIADLNRISDYLNNMKTLKGGFLQIGPDGQSDEGVFYIDKPGRMRFEYHAPNPVLIVSDGTTVAVQNKRLNTVDHYPLFSTPLSLILSDNLNLKKNPSIAGITREPGEIIVNARAASSKMNGNLTLVFAAPNLELRQWTIVDAQGLSTTVQLRDIQPGAQIDPTLFKLPEANGPAK
ncbi:MAG TPA: outer membrane lipoprotein carrier protein LolA, partial [Rhizomicrobium sp.]|nr:outer membrane lipoprotein carrier protein LolA [Rhizomicrobium sp.]